MILQMKGSSKIRDELLLSILALDLTPIGRRLVINQKAALGLYNTKFELTPNNILQILIANREESLPKSGLQIDRIFKKGTIKQLGNCYVTITVYHVGRVSKYDKMTCLKFEVFPFNSKTKLYKLLINSKDLQYYFGIIYPTMGSP